MPTDAPRPATRPAAGAAAGPAPRPVGWRDAVTPGLLALGAALLVVAVGLATYDGHISRFVHAGTWFVTARPGLVRQPGAGYDGQFVYRLALAPFDVRARAHGIRFDLPLRAQRIGLPMVAWVLSGGGRPAAVPVVLVVLEVASVTATGALGGLVAARAGRRPAWGVLLASPVGLVFGVLHDLTEPPVVALTVAGVLLVGARRHGWAALTLAAAALTRETALLTVAAVALPRLAALARTRRPARVDLVWVVPVLVWVAWQAYVSVAIGHSPVGSGGSANIDYPLAGPVGLARALPHAAWHQWPLLVAQLVATAVVLVAAVPTLRRAPAPVGLAAALTAVFVLLLAPVVWTGYDDLRFLAELTALAWLALLASRRPLGRLAAVTAVVWALSLALNRL